MARKINVKLILELREAQLSRNYIADSRHFARNSVSDVFRIAEERGIDMKTAELSQLDSLWEEVKIKLKQNNGGLKDEKD